MYGRSHLTQVSTPKPLENHREGHNAVSSASMTLEIERKESALPSSKRSTFSERVCKEETTKVVLITSIYEQGTCPSRTARSIAGSLVALNNAFILTNRRA
jgi:hypothetical protein